MEIAGRTVVVTGASSGIGAEAAVAFARRGAGAVVLLARTRGLLEDVAGRVTAAGARAEWFPVDLRNPAEVARVAAEALRAVGSADVLVNNAGAGRWLFTEETAPDELRQMIEVPFLAAFHATRAFLPAMLARRSGCIVNVTSLASYVPWPGATGYTAARWAMRGFTEALRADLHGTGIGTMLFTPGEVTSPYWDHNPGALERLPRIARLFPKLTPTQAALALVRAVERDAREVVTPRLVAVTVAFARHFPRLVAWTVTRSGWRHPAARR